MRELLGFVHHVAFEENGRTNKFHCLWQRGRRQFSCSIGSSIIFQRFVWAQDSTETCPCRRVGSSVEFWIFCFHKKSLLCSPAAPSFLQRKTDFQFSTNNFCSVAVDHANGVHRKRGDDLMWSVRGVLIDLVTLPIRPTRDLLADLFTSCVLQETQFPGICKCRNWRVIFYFL